MSAHCGTRHLAKGQVWRTRAAEIHILSLGKRLVHYRIKGHWRRKHVSAQISGLDAMAKYLDANKAKLVTGSSTN